MIYTRKFFRWLMLSSFIFLSTSECTFLSPHLKLSDLARWKVYVSPDAIPSEHYAADEFQKLYQVCTGQQLTRISEPSISDSVICIGPSEWITQRFDSHDVPEPAEEDLVMLVEKKQIALFGGGSRGTIYAVYEFFERFAGVRFLSNDVTHVPDDAVDRIIEPGRIFYHPVFNFRWPYIGEINNYPEFAVRMRCNTVARDERLGGITRQRLINHTFRKQIPVEKYGEAHPEYFALVNGERLLKMWGGGPEPCVTNQEVIDIITQSVLDEIKGAPEWDNYSVSQNDNDAYCRCDSCERINQREQTPMGAHLSLVNAVAERVEQEYPDKMIGTLSYWYTRKPPLQLKPHPNVQIQLADIECCRVHAIDDSKCPKNRGFMQEISDWSRMTDNLYVWTYVTDFRYYDLPFPNIPAISRNLDFYARHHVRGVFMQGPSRVEATELSDLKAYVMSRCLWDPSRDSWKEAQEFCNLYYGHAAPVIWNYIKFINYYAHSMQIHPTCFATPSQLALNGEVALRLFEMFRKALALAENDRIRERVEKVSITAYRTMLEAGAQFKTEGNLLKRLFPEGYENIVDEYITLAEKHNLSMPDERTRFADYRARLLNDYKTGIPVSVLENATWKIVIDPAHNARIIELHHKPSGTNFVDAYQTNLKYGFVDEWLGTDDETTTGGRGFSVSGGENQVTMVYEFPDGSLYTRVIGLSGDRVDFKTEILHKGTDPSDYKLIVHPEFCTGSNSSDYREVTGYTMANNAWVVFNRDLVFATGPDAHFLEDGVNGGHLAFYNHKDKFGIEITYLPEPFGKQRTWWVPDQKQLNLELETRKTELRNDQNFTLEYSFRFLKNPPLEP